MVRRTGLKRAGDLLEELRQRRLAERIDRTNDYHRDERGDDAVLDGGDAAALSQKISHSRSRNMGMSGRSAGGIGNVPRSAGRTHLRARCSFRHGRPFHFRQT